MTKPQCKNCAYRGMFVILQGYAELDSKETIFTQVRVECRRSAPTSSNNITTFKLQSTADWCGDHLRGDDENKRPTKDEEWSTDD